MKKLFLAIALLLCCAPLLADGFADKAKYFNLMRNKPMPLTLQQLRAEPDKNTQPYLEIRGEVNAVKGDAVCLKQGDLLVWISMPAGTHMAELEEEELACLVSYDKNALLSLSGFVCHVWTYKFPLEKYEEEMKAGAARAASSYAPTGLSFAQPSRDIDSSVRSIIESVSHIIRSTNPALSQNEVDAYTYGIIKNCSEYEVHPLLVCAVITEESRFKANATSRAGACGLGQLMPATARGMGIKNPYDPQQNIYGTVRYLKSLQERLCGKSFNELSWEDLSLVLSAYNAGPGRVRKYGGVPPIKETQKYVIKVTNTYKKYLTLSL
ncbi:MAG: lytic transglycosylase domain-containing protein [Abditibacteriota bacterium]|nr:lytic transglycosylase domain-containing protein [Abditibacteriota bacterium]